MLSGSSKQYVKNQNKLANQDLCSAAEAINSDDYSEHEAEETRRIIPRVDKGKGRATDQDDCEGDDLISESRGFRSQPPFSAVPQLEDGESEIESSEHSDAEGDSFLGVDWPRRVNGEDIVELVENGDQNAVWLLKSILPGSRFDGLKRRMNFPIYGHWAVVIFDEVYELNRVGSYAKALLKGRGADARLDMCSLKDYIDVRGGSTLHCERIGTVVRLHPSKIKSAVDERNATSPPLDYSLFTSNCQHFILDLCEHIGVRFEGRAFRVLWFKSRWTFLIGSSLYLASSILYFLSYFHFAHSTDKVDMGIFGYVLPILLIVLLSYVVTAVTVTAPPRTLSGKSYMHGSCHTGKRMEKLLLKATGRERVICIALLRIEKISYFFFLFLGLAATFLLDLIRYIQIFVTGENDSDLEFLWGRMLFVGAIMFNLGRSYHSPRQLEQRQGQLRLV